jgi:hypothetical protein
MRKHLCLLSFVKRVRRKMTRKEWLWFLSGGMRCKEPGGSDSHYYRSDFCHLSAYSKLKFPPSRPF